jgi:hypothetical protein
MSTTQATSNKATFRRLHDVVNTGDAELISKTIDEVVEPDVLIRTPVREAKSVTYNEIFIFRFVNGRIAETWGVVDVYAQLKQLGVIPVERSTPAEPDRHPSRDELLRSDRSVPPGTQ